MRRKILKFVEYAATRSIVFFLNLFPFGVKKVFFIGLARFLVGVMPKIKKRFIKNITLVFPEKEQARVEELCRASVDSMGVFLAEFTQLVKLTPSFLKRYVVMKNSPEDVARVYDGGGIVILGHLGNWELQGAATNFLMKNTMYVMAKRQSNPWSNRWIEKTRLRSGLRPVYTEEGARAVIQKIREEKALVALLADQDAGKNGLLVDFMGILTPTFRGPAFLARKTRCPVYFGSSRHHEGKFEMSFEKMELPGFDPESDPGRWDLEFTRIWSAMLEEKIRENPAEYFWAHNRWKNAPGVSKEP